MPLTVPVLRVLEACRGERTEGPLVLRPHSAKPIDRRDCYRMVSGIAKVAGIPRHISPHSLRHAAITNALDAGVPLRDAQILARHADPRTTGHYDRARGNLDRHGVHFLTAYVAGVKVGPSEQGLSSPQSRKRRDPKDARNCRTRNSAQRRTPSTSSGWRCGRYSTDHRFDGAQPRSGSASRGDPPHRRCSAVRPVSRSTHDRTLRDSSRLPRRREQPPRYVPRLQSSSAQSSNPSRARGFRRNATAEPRNRIGCHRSRPSPMRRAGHPEPAAVSGRPPPTSDGAAP